MTLKIMLAEDHAILREGLRCLIGSQPDMEIIGEAKDGQAAVQMAETLKPDIIIMDITMPEVNGIEATRQIKANNPDVKIIALSAFDKPDFVLGMVKAGASAYLLKDNLFDELVHAIQVVVKGQSYLCPEVATVVVQACQEERTSLSHLDEEELDLVKRLAQGHLAKDIATQLGLSVKTVEGRRRRLLHKLNIDSVAELVHYAISEGLVEAHMPKGT